MTDLISRADAIEAKPEYRNEDMLDKEKSTYNKGWNDCNDAWVAIIKALPSADAEPTAIRSKTLLPTKDFMEWAKRIKEVNPNAVVIPCDAEVVSAEDVQVTGKLKNPCDSLLTDDSAECEEKKSKLESADANQTNGRLIDADTLMDLLNARKRFFVDAYGGFHCMSEKDKARCDEIDACIASIVNAPTASADAVQGEWIWRTDIPIGDGRTSAGYICSNCGKDYWHGNALNFCPNCGARMTPYKGGDDE